MFMVLRIGAAQLNPKITSRCQRAHEYPAGRTKARDVDHVHVTVKELVPALRSPDIVLNRPAGGRRLPALIAERQLLSRKNHVGILHEKVKERQILSRRPQRHVTAA